MLEDRTSQLLCHGGSTTGGAVVHAEGGNPRNELVWRISSAGG